MVNNSRSHNNAHSRVYRIHHTLGELRGRSTEVHGRVWHEAVRAGKLIPLGPDSKVAGVASGYVAVVESKDRVTFVEFTAILNSWSIIESMFIFSGAMSREERDRRQRAGQPLIESECFRVGESRVPVGRKKDKKFIRRVEYATTRPVY